MNKNNTRGVAKLGLTFGVWLAALIVLAATVGGCAPALGTVGADPWVSFTPDEKAEIQVIETALAHMAAECQSQGQPATACIPPRIKVVGTSGSVATYYANGHVIILPHAMLRPASRPTLAHEMGHAWYADAHDGCLQSDARATVCERKANFHAVHILVVGYGYDEVTAANMMWRALVGLARDPAFAAPTLGHPDRCAELHDYEQRFVGMTPYACTERVAGGH